MTRRFFVNELLQDSRVKQCNTTNEEAGVNPFDRRVVDTNGPQGRVDDIVKHRDHQNDGNGVDVPIRKKHVRRVPTLRARDHGVSKTQPRGINNTNAMRSLGVPPNTSEAETVARLFGTCM